MMPNARLSSMMMDPNWLLQEQDQERHVCLPIRLHGCWNMSN